MESLSNREKSSGMHSSEIVRVSVDVRSLKGVRQCGLTLERIQVTPEMCFANLGSVPCYQDLSCELKAFP